MAERGGLRTVVATPHGKWERLPVVGRVLDRALRVVVDADATRESLSSHRRPALSVRPLAHTVSAGAPFGTVWGLLTLRVSEPAAEPADDAAGGRGYVVSFEGPRRTLPAFETVEAPARERLTAAPAPAEVFREVRGLEPGSPPRPDVVQPDPPAPVGVAPQVEPATRVEPTAGVEPAPQVEPAPEPGRPAKRLFRGVLGAPRAGGTDEPEAKAAGARPEQGTEPRAGRPPARRPVAGKAPSRPGSTPVDPPTSGPREEPVRDAAPGAREPGVTSGPARTTPLLRGTQDVAAAPGDVQVDEVEAVGPERSRTTPARREQHDAVAVSVDPEEASSVGAGSPSPARAAGMAPVETERPSHGPVEETPKTLTAPTLRKRDDGRITPDDAERRAPVRDGASAAPPPSGTAPAGGEPADAAGSEPQRAAPMRREQHDEAIPALAAEPVTEVALDRLRTTPTLLKVHDGLDASAGPEPAVEEATPERSGTPPAFPGQEDVGIAGASHEGLQQPRPASVPDEERAVEVVEEVAADGPRLTRAVGELRDTAVGTAATQPAEPDDRSTATTSGRGPLERSQATPTLGGPDDRAVTSLETETVAATLPRSREATADDAAEEGAAPVVGEHHESVAAPDERPQAVEVAPEQPVTTTTLGASADRVARVETKSSEAAPRPGAVTADDAVEEVGREPRRTSPARREHHESVVAPGATEPPARTDSSVDHRRLPARSEPRSTTPTPGRPGDRVVTSRDAEALAAPVPRPGAVSVDDEEAHELASRSPTTPTLREHDDIAVVRGDVGLPDAAARRRASGDREGSSTGAVETTPPVQSKTMPPLQQRREVASGDGETPARAATPPADGAGAGDEGLRDARRRLAVTVDPELRDAVVPPPHMAVDGERPAATTLEGPRPVEDTAETPALFEPGRPRLGSVDPEPGPRQASGHGPEAAPHVGATPPGTRVEAQANPRTGRTTGSPLTSPVLPAGTPRALVPLLGERAGGLPGEVLRAVHDATGVEPRSVVVVRDETTARASAAIRARAFTRDATVYLPPALGPLEREPARSVLAHELVHVVQQRRHGRALPVEGSPQGRALETHASAVAARVANRAGEHRPPAPETDATRAPAPAAPTRPPVPTRSPVPAPPPTRAPVPTRAPTPASSPAPAPRGVQRDPDDTAPGAEPERDDFDLDDLARRLYPRIRPYLRKELSIDRERAALVLGARR